MKVLNLKVLYITDILFLEPISEEDEKILDEICECTNGKISSEALIDLKGLKDLIQICKEKEINILIKSINEGNK